MEQSNSQHLFMTDAEITGHQRKQADMHDRLMAAIPEPKSDKDQIEELRVELAKEREKVKALEATWIGYNKLQEQLAAAQATIAELKTAINRQPYTMNKEVCDALALPTNQDALNQIKAGYEATIAEAADEIESWGSYASEYFQKKHDLAGVVARFRSANQDALCEALARECERLAELGGEYHLRKFLHNEAAAHRARKEGK